MHLHSSIMHNAMASGLWGNGSMENVTLMVVPMFHITGMVSLMHSNIYCGATMVLMPRWDRELAARLIAQWMNTGFIHGVMNTDNMTISGESIDFGPCAFMEVYDPQAVFSSIDHGGRYAYANQPHIARWNLARLAETLLPLIDAQAERAVERATEVLDAFPGWFEGALRRGQRAKLGLRGLTPGQATAAAAHGFDSLDDASSGLHAETDDALAGDWLDLLNRQRVDFTQAWRLLAHAAAGEETRLRALFGEPAALEPWLARWRERLALEPRDSTERAAAMRRAKDSISF
jgi:uncharacterized protein YdiU (UPF0061 family)